MISPRAIIFMMTDVPPELDGIEKMQDLYELFLKHNYKERHDADGHSDILKNLEEKHGSQADDDQITVSVLRTLGDAYDAVHEKGIEPDDCSAAQKSKFFTDDGENEIGFCHR